MTPFAERARALMDSGRLVDRGLRLRCLTKLPRTASQSQPSSEPRHADEPLTRRCPVTDLEPVASAFDGFEFIWHPPMRREIDGEIDDSGPMVSVLVPGNEQSPAVAEALQRFFSAMVFRFGQPVEDVTHGGMCGDDPWNP